MYNFTTVVPFVVGCWMIITASILSTKNFKSALLFQAIPIILGVCSVIVGIKGMGWI